MAPNPVVNSPSLSMLKPPHVLLDELPQKEEGTCLVGPEFMCKGVSADQAMDDHHTLVFR